VVTSDINNFIYPDSGYIRAFLGRTVARKSATGASCLWRGTGNSENLRLIHNTAFANCAI